MWTGLQQLHSGRQRIEALSLVDYQRSASLGAQIGRVLLVSPHRTGMPSHEMNMVPAMLPAQRLVGSCPLDPLLPALGGLSRLQLCGLYRDDDSVAGGQAAALPAGPWLRSLRWLSTDFTTLLSSVPALQAATGLECLSLTDDPAEAINWHSPAAAAFFAWLESHPPLRRLCLEDWSDALGTRGFLLRMLQLWRRRPTLLVHGSGFGDEGEQFGAFVCATCPF